MPSGVVRLLFNGEITGDGVGMTRLAGMALIGFGVACWPGADALRATYGMLTYGVLVTLYLIHIGIRGEAVGVLLWPAVVFHILLSVLLGGAWRKQRKSQAT